ncbi:protein translocase subunit SecD [Fodinisporobacter ferrooxydans]|uniref:Protein translocase subunit SecD n=1 Tax=Fodinisporobacter ferrooxydans TaxID=2901836 RepID=A0ABY4CDJ6_9BACL|nr:protein translocase subunit SecD [Alicyclobacillaceae bacterium MYW30-H2]
MVRWSRFIAFLLIVAIIFGVTGATTKKIWSKIPLGLDLRGGFDILYQIQPTKGQTVNSDAQKATIAALDERLAAMNYTDPVIQAEGTDRVRVQLAGVFDQKAVKSALVAEAKLEFRAPDDKTVLLTGKDLVNNAKYETDPQTNAPVVAVEFKDPKKFADITQKYLQQPIGIWLNDKLLSKPTVQTVIANGKATITGMSSPQEAIKLAQLLNAGALPFPLKQLSSTTVGPSLGESALHSTLVAGLIGIALIFLFMIVMYRIPGLIADCALVAYMFLILATFAGMHLTLTLPGLAALVLGVGMAVDANIITYERIKDELRNGKSILSASISGSRRALRTILDSNVTTLIAGIVMYYYGTGAIKSFAEALIAGIVVSLITAVFLSRLMLMLFMRSNLIKNIKWIFSGKGVQTK